MPSSLTRREMLHLSAAAAGAVLLPSFKSRTIMSPNNIILRTIPSSGEKIPAIGMGTWLTFDAGDSVARRKQLSEVLRIFREGGGKLIDSSPMYGSSETVVGDLVEQDKSRKDLFFATKVWTTGQPRTCLKNQFLSASYRISTGCKATRPVPSLIWCRQLVPGAAIITSSFWIRTAGNKTSSPIFIEIS